AADHHAGGDAVHDLRIPPLADRDDPAAFNADIGLYDPPVIEDHRVGDDQVERPLRRGRRHRLAHSVAKDFSAAELALVAVDGEVALDPDDQVGVGQPDPVPRRRPEHLGVNPPRDLQAHRGSSLSGAPSSFALGPVLKFFSRSRPSAPSFCASPVPPSVRPFSPRTLRSPPSATRTTRFFSPGSNRTALPEGMFSRIPNALSRSNERARLTSKK